jgi:hypothetical protein
VTNGMVGPGGSDTITPHSPLLPPPTHTYTNLSQLNNDELMRPIYDHLSRDEAFLALASGWGDRGAALPPAARAVLLEELPAEGGEAPLPSLVAVGPPPLLLPWLLRLRRRAGVLNGRLVLLHAC